MENWFDKNKFFEKLLVLTWIIFLLICLGLLSFTSHAASAGGNGLPYYVDNESFSYSGYSVTQINNYLNGRHNTTYDFSKNTVMYTFRQGSETRITIYTAQPGQSSIYYFSNFSHSLDGFDTTTNYCQMTITHCCKFVVVAYSSGLFEASNDLNRTFSFNLFGSYYTPIYIGSKFYNQTYINNVLNTSDTLILTDELAPVIQVGHATPPDPFDDPVVPSGHTLPHQVPTLTINNYSWTTAPTPDLTTLENAVNSIFDILQWLSSNLIGSFNNFISNLQNIGNYIGSTIQYYGGLIISNIQNAINTFYNNMQSLIEPISAKIDYLTEPVDGTVIYDNISSSSLITNYNSINTALTSFKGSFDSLSEPSSFTIPIHLENLPSAYFGNQTTQYIDLGVIGSTEKGIIRAFMWALITYGLFITIVDSVSNYINGGGDES